MNCPQCKAYALEPYEIEPGLVACRCPKCEGGLLPLMNYRYWIDQHPDVPLESTATSIAEDSVNAKVCPKCSRLMTKFKIGVELENRIELCTMCDEVWLDDGEWQLLKTLDVHNKLPNIFTDAWQRNIRIKRQELNLNAHYQQQLGGETFERSYAFKKWLDSQPEKSQIVQYLITKSV